jgi:membrane-associated phospholipid phosphatase
MHRTLDNARRAFGPPRLRLARAVAVGAFLALVASFAFLAQAYVTGDATVDADLWLAKALHANETPPATTPLVAVTLLGSTPALALAAGSAGGYLVGRRRHRDAALLVVVLCGAQLLGWILKASFERPRPSFDDPLALAGWFSFPSGHAMSSIALYGALAYVFAGRLHSPKSRLIGLGGVAVLVVAIGFSRLYLGVHYLTDVLAGYSAGLAWLLLVLGLYKTVLSARRRVPHAVRSRPGGPSLSELSGPGRCSRTRASRRPGINRASEGRRIRRGAAYAQPRLRLLRRSAGRVHR